MSSSIHTPTMTNIDDHSNKSSSMTIAPLYSGYGHTLGNSLRRVMLSWISGAAPTAVKLDGATHEFTTIEGVKEDVVSIIQKIKQLSIRSYSDEPIVISINKKINGEVKASDFDTGSEVEILNPELVIATTGKSTELKVDVRVEIGRGYRTADDQENIPADFIKIDSIFSPVVRVRYKVQATRVGQNTDLDELVLTVDTDGSVTPSEAFEEANAILSAQYQALAGSTTVASAGTLSKELEDQEDDSELKTSVEDLNLSARTTNALVNNEIMSVGDLMSLSNSELKDLKGFGSKALDEVKAKLQELSL